MLSTRLCHVMIMLCLITVFSSSQLIWAEDTSTMNMSGRLGIGANMTLNGAMGMSARYWISDVIATEAVFNYTNADIGEDSGASYFVLAGRGMFMLFDYGTVHGLAGAGMSFGTLKTETYSQDESENFFGMEFFFMVENMINEFFSISGQTGLTYISADDSSILSVGTPSVIGLFGFHFYM